MRTTGHLYPIQCPPVPAGTCPLYCIPGKRLGKQLSIIMQESHREGRRFGLWMAGGQSWLLEAQVPSYMSRLEGHCPQASPTLSGGEPVDQDSAPDPVASSHRSHPDHPHFPPLSHSGDPLPAGPPFVNFTSGFQSTPLCRKAGG